MARAVVAGVDGSPESVAAARWAAREAVLRGLPLQLVHAWNPLPSNAQFPIGQDTQRAWAQNRLDAARERIAERHPGLSVDTKEVTDAAVPVLLRATEHADLLVLGSRGLSGIARFLLGSVGLAVVSRCSKPVVLVRADQEGKPENGSEAAQPAEPRSVVLGLDFEHGGDAPIEFAFRAAAARGAQLRAVHGWNPFSVYGYAAEPLSEELRAEVETQEASQLAEALASWRAKFPDVRVDERLVDGRPTQVLLDSAAGADLLVVGRRQRRTVVGSRLGHVTQAVLHHAASPVAVVPHD